MVARYGAFFLFVLSGCSTDTFVGEDGSADAAADAPSGDVGHPESGGGDAIAVEGGTTSFCSLHPEAFFCDDWDDASENVPWAKWSTTTPSSPSGVIAFGAGVNARGVVMKAPATAQTFLTRQTQNDALGGLVFDMRIENVTALTTYVRVTAESKTFTLASDVSASHLMVAGDSGAQTQLGGADTKWHHFVVTFSNSSAAVSEDNNTALAVPFSPMAPTSSTLDIGIVAGTLGGTVDFDNVLLR